MKPKKANVIFYEHNLSWIGQSKKSKNGLFCLIAYQNPEMELPVRKTIQTFTRLTANNQALLNLNYKLILVI